MNKKWFGLGLVVYVLSLPLLFWKSSRLGRVLSVLFMCYVGFFALNRFSDIGVRIYTKAVLLRQFNGVQVQLVSMNNRLDATQKSLDMLDGSVRQLTDTLVERMANELRNRITTTEEHLRLIEQATSDLSNEERQRVKSRIIEIREKIKLLDGSVDSSILRKQIEEIVPGISLLKEEEKARFLQDLLAIGFSVDRVEKELHETWNSSQEYLGTSGNMLTSGMVVTWGDSK